jgi:hypothetical protein
MHAPDLLIQQVAAVLVLGGVPPVELHLGGRESLFLRSVAPEAAPGYWPHSC